MTSPTKAPEPLLQRLRQGARFLITSHINPDGDAIGSQLGLVRVLRGLGKSSVVWNLRPRAGALPPAPRQRPHPRRRRAAGRLPRPVRRRHCARVPDARPHRPRRPARRAAADQHRPPSGQLALRARSTGWTPPRRRCGEMIYRLAHGLKVPLDPETATALYLTLVTDTGGFRFANATAGGLRGRGRAGARGRAAGAGGRVALREPARGHRAAAGRDARLAQDRHATGRIATALLTAEMFARAGADAGEHRGTGRRAALDRRGRGGGPPAPGRRPATTRCRCAAAARSTSSAWPGGYGGGGHQQRRRLRRRRRRRARCARLVVAALEEALRRDRRCGDGLLLVDKEAGGTSHDVVQRARRLLGQKKIGHCGTLDPDATGLLLLTLGRATRLTRFLIRAPKVYEGALRFGVATDTYDASGRVTGEASTAGLDAGRGPRRDGRARGHLRAEPAPLLRQEGAGGALLRAGAARRGGAGDEQGDHGLRARGRSASSRTTGCPSR